MRNWDVAETASKHDRRKNFLLMIEYLKDNQQVKHVIFSHQSRSNRNRESAREIENLVWAKITIHFARDSRKLTCESDLEEWLLWDVYNNLNEKFIKDHTKNVMDGVIKRVEMGLFPGKAPIGYRNFRRQDQLSIFVIEEGEGAYVKKVFERFSTGRYSMAALHQELEGEFFNLKSKIDSKRFDEILRNPFYYGEFVYDGLLYKGHPEFHPILIPFTLWKKVQNILNKPDRSKRKVELSQVELSRNFLCLYFS